MRKGFLCCLTFLVGGSLVQAQQWPAYRQPQGYPAYPVSQGASQYPVWPAARPQGFNPGYAPGFVPYAAPMPYGAYPVPIGPPTYLAMPTPPASQAKVESTPAVVAEASKEDCKQLPTLPLADLPILSADPDGPQAIIVDPSRAASIPQPMTFHRPHHDHLWFTGEYLFSHIKGGPLGIPLVTTGARNDPVPGAVGSPGTVVLFGDESLEFDALRGFRVGLGLWLNHENCYSFTANGFWLSPEHIRFAARSDPTGNPIITRPVIDPTEPREAALLTSFPGVAAGIVSVDARTQVYGVEANLGIHSYHARHWQFTCLAGFRSIHLEEDLIIRDQLTILQGGALTFLGQFLNPGDMLHDEDRFETQNTFYGFQLGGKARYEQDWYFIDVFAKAAVGINNQRVLIDGQTALTSPAGNGTATGGVLAQGSNIGDRRRHRLGIVPEAGLNLGVDATPHIRLIAGYSFLYWDKVVRPGLQIDRTVSPAQNPTDQAFGILVGPSRPRRMFEDESFYMHNFNFGVEFHY